MTERFSCCSICKVDSLTVVLLLAQLYLKFDLVNLGLGDLCLKVDLIFAQFAPSQRIVCDELLLHRGVFHDCLAVVTILSDLFLEGRYFYFLLALELFLVSSLAQLRKLVLHLQHLLSVGLQEVLLVLLKHMVQLLVKVRDLVVYLS